jgi:hypothetical protein
MIGKLQQIGTIEPVLTFFAVTGLITPNLGRSHGGEYDV